MVCINVIASVKTLLTFGCIDGCWSLNCSRILKFEKVSGLGPDLKTLEQERSRDLKMLLWPEVFGVKFFLVRLQSRSKR